MTVFVPFVIIIIIILFSNLLPTIAEHNNTRIYAIRMNLSSYRRFLYSSMTTTDYDTTTEDNTSERIMDADPAKFFQSIYTHYHDYYVQGASMSDPSLVPIHYRFQSKGFRQKGYVLVSLRPRIVPLFKKIYGTYIQNIYPIDDDYDNGEISAEDTMTDVPSSNLPSYYNWGLDRIDQRYGNLDHQTFTVHRNTNGEGIDVYILDTGIQPYHQEFLIDSLSQNNTKVLYGIGYNFLSDQIPSDVFDSCHGHGTMVASQIAGNNVGVAPNVSIIPIRVIGCDGRFLISNILKGIDYAIYTATEIRNNPHRSIINLSGRAFSISPPLDDAASIVGEASISFIVASGNEAKNACNFSPNTKSQLPLYFPIVVGGTLKPQTNVNNENINGKNVVAMIPPTSYDYLADYSNYGTCVDINGPSEDIYGASFTCSTCYRLWTGTSFATPIVTGIVAGIRQNYPSWSVDCVRTALLTMATPDVVHERTDHNTTRRMAYRGMLLDIPLVC